MGKETQFDQEKRCMARSRYGHRCTLGRDSGSEYCHMHNPEGDYARQHPTTFVAPIHWDARMDAELW